MGAPSEEPKTKISLNVPDRILDRLRDYPGEQTWKIVQLLEYGLAAGFFMTPEEATELAQERAMRIMELAQGPKPDLFKGRSGVGKPIRKRKDDQL